MKTQKQLANNIVGQMNGLIKMMDEEKDCFAVLTQMKAAKSAMNTLMNRFLEEQFIGCLGKCRDKESQGDVCKKFFSEITKIS